MVGENESIDIPVPSPVGVLLFHGLFGTPNELHVLGGEIARAGYRVRIPLLPGRGADWDELGRLAWRDVARFARAQYEELACEHEQVVLGGLSAGGTLALDSALAHPPAALLLYAVPLTLRPRGAWLAPYAWRLIPTWPMRIEGPVVRERVPLRAVAELVGAMGRVRSRLGEIRAPALVAHAKDDPLVPFSSAQRLKADLGGPVELATFEGSEHALTFGPGRDRLAALTLAFLRAHVPLEGNA